MKHNDYDEDKQLITQVFSKCKSAEERRTVFFALQYDMGYAREDILAILKELGVDSDFEQ